METADPVSNSIFRGVFSISGVTHIMFVFLLTLYEGAPGGNRKGVVGCCFSHFRVDRHGGLEGTLHLR